MPPHLHPSIDGQGGVNCATSVRRCAFVHPQLTCPARTARLHGSALLQVLVWWLGWAAAVAGPSFDGLRLSIAAPAARSPLPTCLCCMCDCTPGGQGCLN